MFSKKNISFNSIYSKHQNFVNELVNLNILHIFLIKKLVKIIYGENLNQDIFATYKKNKKINLPAVCRYYFFENQKCINLVY